MEKLISNIVFTMNRPLQLEAYLESLYRHLPRQVIQSYVLYKLDKFERQYDNLFERFSDCIVVKEEAFHDDFMNLLERIETKYVLFGTDDVVYYDSVDFSVIDDTFERFPQDIFGFSLRLSPSLLADQGESAAALKVAGQDVFRIDWHPVRHGIGGYPFELNSTVYQTSLVRRIVGPVAREHPTLKRLFQRGSFEAKLLGLFLRTKGFLAGLETFRDPNTLEGLCHRWCKTHKRKLPRYLYFQKLCASAIQVNQVNTTIDNPIDSSEEHTVQALNEKYEQGYRFDIEAVIENRPRATHVGREYLRLAKKY